MAEKENATPNTENEVESADTAPVAECKEDTAVKDKEKSSKKESKKNDKKKEKSELEKLQDDYAALNDKYVRLMAEYDNFRKRSQRERDAIYPEATASAAASFLAVADNFERALAAECADAEYKKGTELTYQSLMEAFSKLGVESFGDKGDKFDPNCHNAVMHVEDEGLDAESIAEVFQRGYRLGDRIIRHAMVKVAN